MLKYYIVWMPDNGDADIQCPHILYYVKEITDDKGVIWVTGRVYFFDTVSSYSVRKRKVEFDLLPDMEELYRERGDFYISIFPILAASSWMSRQTANTLEKHITNKDIHVNAILGKVI